MGVDPEAAANVAAGFAKLAGFDMPLATPLRECGTHRRMKQLFEFEIVINVPGGALEEAEFLDALFKAGLDDTIVGLGRPDRIALSFTGDGTSLEQVLTDAVVQIISAFPSASVQIVDLATMGNMTGKAEVIRRVRAVAAQKATAGDGAAASQDFLYGPDGLP